MIEVLTAIAELIILVILIIFNIVILSDNISFKIKTNRKIVNYTKTTKSIESDSEANE